MTNMVNTYSSRMDSTEKNFSTSRSSNEPPTEAKDRFEKALSEDERGDSSGKQGEGKSKNGEDGSTQGMPSAEALFNSLFENKMGTVTAAAPAPADLGELVDTLAERIMVSDPKSNTPTEVRIQLNDSILADTQIALNRSQDGTLHIQLLTGNTSSMQTLVAAQYALAEQLESQGPVIVKVSNTQEGGQSDNDSNRRSQGMMEYEQENV